MANITQKNKLWKPLQLELFEEHLPKKPYCTDDLSTGLSILPRLDAIKRLYIEANGPTHLYWLVFDVDRETASFDWEDLRCPAPNIVVTNRENGHAHLFYGLEVPVRKAPDAQLKPLRYAAAVEFGLCKQLQADYGYAGLIAKNPLRSDHWLVQTYEDRSYSLGWLADYIDLEKIDYRKRPADYGLGRNVTLFNRLRLWAYRAIRGEWLAYDQWHAAVLDRAVSYNEFPAPLPFSEIKATAKSVAKWVWQHFSAASFSAIQAARGIKSGLARRKGMEDKAQLVMTFDGLPSSVVASMTGIPIRTVQRLRARLRNR